MKNKLKNSLHSQMLKMTLIPLVILTIAIVAVSASIVRTAITNQIKGELIYDADLVNFVIDEFYQGEFSVEYTEDEQVEIYKGGELISGKNSITESLSEILDIDISIFYNDVRLVTTLKDGDGVNAIGTQAAPIVKKDVLETGESAFYDNVIVYGEKSFAYYKPLISSDGKIFGMIAVCRNGSAIESEVIKYVIPVAGICIFVLILFGVTIMHFNRKLVKRIEKMDKYMNTLANGEFDVDMPTELMSEDDEIKHLASDGKRMAFSIKKLVEFDALTDLNNRRSADKKLNEIRLRSVEQGLKYCVCIGDIDFFKKVNDTYGHEMGDEVLRMVAAKLKAGMVGKGFVARWGGEEFLLIFENRELDIARRELEIILDEVRTIWVPNSDRQITMSFGLTALEPGESVDKTLSRADGNLYEAKEGGRNQIVYK